MANICTSTLIINHAKHVAAAKPFTDDALLAKLTSRIEAITYEGHDIVPEDEYVPVSADSVGRPFDDIAALSKELHLEILCTFNEPGMCFMGAYHVADGEVIQDESISY